MTSPVLRALRSVIPRQHSQRLRSQLGTLAARYHSLVHGYDASGLETCLRGAGLGAGDVVLMHAAFKPTNGFLGAPREVLDVVLELLGPRGTLVMTSLPYTSSTREYLSGAPVFDVRRTPSRMGILTELLRRRSGVVRSLSPTHALVAIGAHARELLENHEACLYPCGPGSPFERMLEADAKMLFFDLPFLGFTFVHYIEHQIQDRLPFPLYDPEPATARIRDFEGREREVRCFVLSEESGRRRRVDVITHEMRDEGTAYWKRLGNTEIVVARMRDALETGMRLAERGRIPFQPPSST